MSITSAPVRVRVPATSANLGPGYDALGLALSLHDELTARSTSGGVTVRVSGEGAGQLPEDGSHLVIRAMDAAFDVLGERPAGVDLICRNRIPQARGLGSSSAAIVAGILLARGMVSGGGTALDGEAVLRLAAELEGHPDNVAPCLLGGFTIAWTEPIGSGSASDSGFALGSAGDAGGSAARAVRLTPAQGVRPIVFVPAERGLTEQARAALPASVPHADAAFNAGRSALLVHALTSAPDLLLAATDDRLHQPYRAAGMPATARLVAELRAAGVAAMVSGAGPSVLALVPPDWRVAEVNGWLGLQLSVDFEGATTVDENKTGSLIHAEQDPVAAGRAS